MQLSKIDLRSFHDFPPQPSAHTALCLSLNAKGELSMNTALRRAMGEIRDFHGMYSDEKGQILLYRNETPNVHFSKSGGISKNRALAETLEGLGFKLPLRYDVEWVEELHAWLGVCQEMDPPPAVPALEKPRRRRKKEA